MGRGPWPKKKYGSLVAAHSNMLGSLILLASAYSRLEPQWCRRLERADHLHPAFVSYQDKPISRFLLSNPGGRLLSALHLAAPKFTHWPTYAADNANL
jgi:hypothetical protein